MKRLRIAVLMGGPSAEAAVSRKSGQMVLQALQGTGAVVMPVDIEGPDFDLPANLDVAFIALHGTFGEDGQVQRILEERGVRYTGSDPEASARAFDKAVAKEHFLAAGIPTPEYAIVNGDLSGLANMKLPLVVKPARQGSSVGVTIVHDRAGLDAACAKAREFDECVIVERFIRGRELTVGILGTRTLPIVEIIPHREFFNYEAKYQVGGAEEIVPAPLDAPLAAKVHMLALFAHQQLGCRDVSRVDLMLSESGALYVLEVNTIPGMTATSLLPKAAEKAGLNMQELCVRIVELALAHKPEAVVA